MVALSSLCLLFPLPLAAAERRSLMVLVVGLDPVSAELAGSLNRSAHAAAERSARFSPVRLVDVLDPQEWSRRKAKLAEAEAEYAAGFRAYEELDTLKAAQGFDAAVKAYRSTDLSLTHEALVQSWVMKAAAMVANGSKGARAEIERIIAFAPEAKLSPSYFPPDLLKQAEDARRAAAQGKLALTVETTPSGAEIYLDGKYRGQSPLSLAKLAAGEHQLSVISPGYSLTQVAAGGSNQLTLSPAEAHGRWRVAVTRIAQQPESALRDLAARELGRWVGAEQVLLLVAQKSTAGEKLEVTGFRLETQDGHHAAHQRASLPLGDSLEAAAEGLLARLLEKDAPRENGRPVTQRPLPGGPGVRLTPGYGLLAAGTAIFAGGLLFGLKASAQAAQFRQTPQGSSSANQLRSDGQTNARLADVFMLGGMAAAGLGGYLSYFGTGDLGAGKVGEPLPEKRPPRQPERNRREQPEEQEPAEKDPWDD